jgi:hypothetical protein
LATLVSLREAAIPTPTRDRGRSAAVLYPQLRSSHADARRREKPAKQGRRDRPEKSRMQDRPAGAEIDAQ